MDPETRKRLGLDPYTANIELSNACRQFYQNRLRVAERLKAQLPDHKSRSQPDVCECDQSPESKIFLNDSGISKNVCVCNNNNNNNNDNNDQRVTVCRTFIDNIVLNNDISSNASCDKFRNVSNTLSSYPIVGSHGCSGVWENKASLHDTSNLQLYMSTLRAEMIALMDQDLSLMKQLLTLNETIEELKLEQRYGFSNRSNGASYSDFSDTELYDSEIDLSRACSPSPALTSVAEETTADLSSLIRQYDSMLKFDRRPLVSSPRSSPLVQRAAANRLDLPKDSCHADQNSFDSGIHCDDERVMTA